MDTKLLTEIGQQALSPFACDIVVIRADGGKESANKFTELAKLLTQSGIVIGNYCIPNPEYPRGDVPGENLETMKYHLKTSGNCNIWMDDNFADPMDNGILTFSTKQQFLGGVQSCAKNGKGTMFDYICQVMADEKPSDVKEWLFMIANRGASGLCRFAVNNMGKRVLVISYPILLQATLCLLNLTQGEPLVPVYEDNAMSILSFSVLFETGVNFPESILKTGTMKLV